MVCDLHQYLSLHSQKMTRGTWQMAAALSCMPSVQHQQYQCPIHSRLRWGSMDESDCQDSTVLAYQEFP
jgi:hypothetical protein